MPGRSGVEHESPGAARAHGFEAPGSGGPGRYVPGLAARKGSTSARIGSMRANESE